MCYKVLRRFTCQCWDEQPINFSFNNDHCSYGIVILLKNVDILNKWVPWYFTTVEVFIKNMTVVRVCDSNPVSFTIVTNFQCTIATIVKYNCCNAIVMWSMATLVTGWFIELNWIYLWSMEVLRFFWMRTANHSVHANGLIHPDYGRQFQAKTEFRSGRFFNYTRCSALAPAQSY